jgi:hypothetical protein
MCPMPLPLIFISTTHGSELDSESVNQQVLQQHVIL